MAAHLETGGPGISPGLAPRLPPRRERSDDAHHIESLEWECQLPRWFAERLHLIGKRRLLLRALDRTREEDLERVRFAEALRERAHVIAVDRDRRTLPIDVRDCLGVEDEPAD